MSEIVVVIEGVRKGPYKRSEVASLLRKGEIPEIAELLDAVTGDIVLSDDLLAQPAISDSLPGERRGRPSSYTRDAVQASESWGAEVYGQNPDGSPAQPPAVRQERNWNPGAVAVIAAFLCPLLGLGLGVFALRRSRMTGEGEGWAIAAIIIAVIMMVGGLTTGRQVFAG
jgi:hypothetical protein